MSETIDVKNLPDKGRSHQDATEANLNFPSVVDLLRRPVTFGSLVGAITLSGFWAISNSHWEIAAVSVVVLGVAALIVLYGSIRSSKLD
jgi:hypothetical protein